MCSQNLRERKPLFRQTFTISIAIINLLSVFAQAARKPDGAKNTPLFELQDPNQTRLVFSNDLPVNVVLNIMNYEYYYNGGGVAVGDIDNDGLPDIYLTANIESNRLFRNLGNLYFEDITETSETGGGRNWTTGTTMADVNADGWLDIYVCQSGPLDEEARRNLLFLNNRDGTFTKSAAEYGLDSAAYSTQALFFDMDRDNDLDMFLLNHNVEWLTLEGLPEIRQVVDPRAGDQLFRNNGGSFTDISGQAGILRNALGFGLGVAAGDLNGDSWPDLYVANDYAEPDYLYLNNQDGTFREVNLQATNHISNFGMGVDIADYNNDGLPDIVVGDMMAEDHYRAKTNMASMSSANFYHNVRMGLHHQYMLNTLQLNRGKERFSEVAQLAGIAKTDWSWALLLADFDNDGWKDLYVSNGFRREHANNDFSIWYESQEKEILAAQKAGNLKRAAKLMEEALQRMVEGKLPNYMFQNQKDLTFAKMGEKWGLAIDSFSNGAAYADLDRDGDLDLVVNNIDQPAFLLKNLASERRPGRFLRVNFKGPEANPFGIGAKVTLRNGDFLQVQENYPTRGYQSSVPPELHFGMPSEQPVSLEVVWPDGRHQSMATVKPGQALTIRYDESESAGAPRKEQPAYLFNDVTDARGIDFRHRENPSNDFVRETLLPHMMSRFGPALAVADVNGDGLEDFYVGGASGQSGALFLQEENGGFIRGPRDAFAAHIGHEDVGAAFLDTDNDGDQDLYVASGGNEFPPGNKYLEDRLYLNDGQGRFSFAQGHVLASNGSNSVVAPFDYDGDGDTDLFVGGRVLPQQYPLPAKSYLLKNEGGAFRDVSSTDARGFNKLGLVTAATWADMDMDGRKDLVVTGEWMPLTIFRNTGERLEKMDTPTLETATGWWFSLAARDFDRDGDMDFIAGNLGLNYKYKASPEAPFWVHADDFDGTGSLDIVLSYTKQGTEWPLRGRECSSVQMPFIEQKFQTFHEFGLANLVDIYGQDELDNSASYKSTRFSHALVENLGQGSFRFHDLPILSQISTLNGIVIGDFNKDGLDDLVVAGNLHTSEVETVRADASYGLLLVGSGGMQFEPVPANESGLLIDGDVKALQEIRLTDGSLGILAAVNDDRLRLIKVAR